MKSKTFRLEEISIEQLKDIANARNETQTDAIRFAIQKGHEAILGAIHENNSSQDEPGDGGNDVWRELFLKEHEKLLALTDKVADSLQASQTLQAMDRPMLESAEQKKSRWGRLKEAWHG